METSAIPPLPQAFADRMRQQLGSDYANFQNCIDGPPPISLRLHPVRGAQLFSDADPVRWYAKGRYLAERPVFTLDPNFHAGAYYVQEASSMLLGPAVRELMAKDRPWRILDLCAAPGGKSTLLSEIAPTGSILVANEVIASRSPILRHNIQKWGFGNTVVTQADPEGFAGLPGFFDLIVVDAPCSGEGLFRKDLPARTVWNPELVDFCATRQRRILRAAVPLLAEGGVLVYSTCTLNQAENEEQGKWLEEEMGLAPEKPSFPDDWHLLEEQYGYYALPHRVRGEGFYLSTFRQPNRVQSYSCKKDQLPRGWQRLGNSKRKALQDWVEHPEELLLLGHEKGSLRLLQHTTDTNLLPLFKIKGKIWVGSEIGQQKGAKFLPAQGLALSLYRSSKIASIDLDQQQAWQFLKGESLPPEPNWPKGWQLMTYEGRGLGWAKVLDKRINNYYPKADRIRMSIPG
jgi:16S rRNA C967 or C1407 C5-methylase (RsmB/RsmF family)/NOL1/NOP2/fmu family ribosome biogenesis protein